MKKGQVTFFVIFGVLLVIIVLGYLYSAGFLFSSRLDAQKAKLATVPTEFLPVKALFDQCALHVARDARTHVFLRGGQYGNSGVFIDELGYSVLLWHDGTLKTLPTFIDIEKSLSMYVDASYSSCLDFSSLSGFSFDSAIVTSDVSLGNDSLVFVIDYPLTVTHKGITQKMPPVVTELDSDFVSFYTAAERVLSAETVDVDFTLLMGLPFEADVSVLPDALVYAFFTKTEGVMFARAL